MNGPKRAPAVLAFVALLTGTALAQNFEGEFLFQWLDGLERSHREMKLLKEVAFIDQSGQRWQVPADEVTDGASIPPPLWSFAGSPFTGTYRRAAVIHDHYCRIGTLPAAKVHELFWEGMLADGTNWLDAQIKHAAVVMYDQLMSRFGEGCGIESRPLADVASSAQAQFDADMGVRITDEVMARLELYEAVPFSEIPLQRRISELIDFAHIERRATYQSLVRFGAVPIEANYDAVEQAIAFERPDREQLDILLNLARATLVAGGQQASW